MNFSLPNNYTISTDKTVLDVPAIHNYLSTQSYWAKNIPMAIVQKCVDNSFCFGVYYHNKQVGFARVVTDYATFAYLADVYIDAQHRGLQLSKCLMQHIMNHPQLQSLRRWMLATADAHELYRQFGWENLLQPDRIMAITKSNMFDGK